MKRHFRSHHLFLSMISILLLLSLTSCAATNSESQSGHAKGNSSATDNNASTSSESTETSESTTKTDDDNFSASPLYSQYRLTYTDTTGYSLPYCLYLPKKEAFPEDSEKTSYPLVLFLHGAGERGTDNELQNNDTGIVPRLTDETFYAAHPCILVVPQCPADAQWVNTPWTKGSYFVEETPISPALSAASELLDDICAQYPADTSRLYITGVSMGGYGAWDLLLRRPDLFAGAIILCGAGDPSQAAAIAHIPLRLFHGAKDTEVPVSGSREMYQALLDAGANDVQYQEYPDISHWIWLNAWDEPGLLDWLFSVSK